MAYGLLNFLNAEGGIYFFFSERRSIGGVIVGIFLQENKWERTAYVFKFWWGKWKCGKAAPRVSFRFVCLLRRNKQCNAANKA